MFTISIIAMVVSLVAVILIGIALRLTVSAKKREEKSTAGVVFYVLGLICLIVSGYLVFFIL